MRRRCGGDRRTQDRIRTAIWIWIAGLIVLVCLSSGLARAETAGPVGAPSGPWREQIHWVPMEDSGGRAHLLYTRICRPLGEQPARVVLINHGKPRTADVGKIKPAPCSSEAVQWFLNRGYLVVLGVRRGYGATGGDLAELISGCSTTEMLHAAYEGARDVDALLRYATALPYARPEGVVVVGQSVGGWISDGYDSLQHPHVVAMVSMAGGHGGHFHDTANLNCRPDQLIAAAGIMGKTATTPMLWVYTENDSYFAPALAKSMYEAFSAAGGKADFHPLPPFAKDGHSLFFGPGGSAIWGPLMDDYLGRMVGR